MKFSNMRVGDLGVGGVVFPQGVIVDISSYALTPDQVRSISASVATGTLRAEDAEAQQLSGLTATPNAQFYLPPGVVGVGSSGSSGFSVVAISGTKDGVNTAFTIADGTVGTCVPVLNGVMMVEGTNFTRTDADITVLTPMVGATDTFEALVSVGGSGGTGSTATPLVTEDLTGLKNGVNDTFTIPTVPTSWCAIYWGPTRLLEGVGFTRAGATVTMLPGHIPQSGDQLYADHD
jgi:hypothetical protein